MRYYQIIYAIKKKNCTRTWWWKLAYRFNIFNRFNHSFKWVKYTSSRWKLTYQSIQFPNYNSVLMETEIIASSNWKQALLCISVLWQNNPINCKKCIALYVNLTQKFENRFQAFRRHIWHTYDTVFSPHVSCQLSNSSWDCNTQLKEK